MRSQEDEYIGSRLKEIRKRKNLSQKDVATYLDLSYQQIQQYESGSTRIPASVLYRISAYLQVPPGYFFEGLEELLAKTVKSNTINTVRKQPLQVMLVEDNLADEELIRAVMGPMNVTLDIVRESEGFMHALGQMNDIGDGPRAELILLDLAVGKEDGINLLNAAKRNRTTCDIPVIILTNSIRSDDVIRAYKAGASGFIKKSPALQDMEARMEQIIHYWSHITLPSMQFVAA